MKRVIMLLTMFFVLVSAVNASDMKLLPVNVEVSVDFDGERDFRIEMDNGLERHFFWDENETHSDESFTHTIYQNVNMTTWCDNGGEYQTLTQSMCDMLDTCRALISTINISQKQRDDYEEKITECSIVERDRDIYYEKWELVRNISEDCTSELDACEKDLKTASANSDRYSVEKPIFDQCEADLDDCESSKNNMFLFGLAIGAGGMWFFMRKKGAGNVPSEQHEAGVENDRVFGPGFGG